MARALAGGDPLSEWAAAEADLADAARRQPAYADPLVALGVLHLERSRFLRSHARGDGRAELTAAARALDQALAIDPEHAEARVARARLR